MIISDFPGIRKSSLGHCHQRLQWPTTRDAFLLSVAPGECIYTLAVPREIHKQRKHKLSSQHVSGTCVPTATSLIGCEFPKISLRESDLHPPEYNLGRSRCPRPGCWRPSGRPRCGGRRLHTRPKKNRIEKTARNLTRLDVMAMKPWRGSVLRNFRIKALRQQDKWLLI